MRKKRNERTITAQIIQQYADYLREQERSTATIEKYVHDLTALYSFLDGEKLTKNILIAWKGQLTEQYAPASVNAMLAAMNGLLQFCGWIDLRVKPLKI